MIIAPKITIDRQDVPKLIVPYMSGAVGFHLTPFTRGEANQRAIVEKYGLRHITLYIPFGAHSIEEVVLSILLYSATLNYLLCQKQYAEELGIIVYMLFYVSYTLESIINSRIADRINTLTTSVGESPSLLLLLESTVTSLDMEPAGDYKEPLSYTLKKTDTAQARIYSDLCHYQASKNVLLEEYTLPANWRDRVYQAHFNDMKNNEGYRHIAAAHGKVHDSMRDVTRDLCTLRPLGIGVRNTVITTEMSKDDYSARNLKAGELGWLHQVGEQGLTF